MQSRRPRRRSCFKTLPISCRWESGGELEAGAGAAASAEQEVKAKKLLQDFAIILQVGQGLEERRRGKELYLKRIAAGRTMEQHG